MAWRAYLLPIETVVGGPGTFVERPKYLGAPTLGNPRGMLDAGSLGICLVWVNLGTAEHNALVANADVLAAPADLQGTIANATQRDNVRDKLEGWEIPAHWVVIGMTFGSVLRGVACLFLLAQQLRRQDGARFLPNGVTMATTMAQLTQAQRNRLQDACARLGWSTEGVTGSTTVRQFLRLVATRHARSIRIRDLVLSA